MYCRYNKHPPPVRGRETEARTNRKGGMLSLHFSSSAKPLYTESFPPDRRGERDPRRSDLLMVK
jgi:hypothetical protein